MKNRNGYDRYYAYRIRLEKLKRSTVLLLVIARVLLLLVVLIQLSGRGDLELRTK